MFRTSKVEPYLAHLYESGLTSISKLDVEHLQDLTVHLMREMPTKHLPKIEDYDKNRDIMLMLAKWMEGEDEHEGYKLLCEMRDIALKAFEGVIEDKLSDYTRREEAAEREGAREREIDIYLDNKQRL